MVNKVLWVVEQIAKQLLVLEILVWYVCDRGTDVEYVVNHPMHLAPQRTILLQQH